MLRKIASNQAVLFGCDPEIFLTCEVGKVRKRKAVVGSEVVVPEKGIKIYTAGYEGRKEYSLGEVVRDGVQVELHPIESSCRASQSNYLKTLFEALRDAVDAESKASGKDIKIDFSQVVKLSKGDLAMLSDAAKQLGCMPSLNVYGRPHIQKDGTKYLTRSAAGHIHLGSNVFKDGTVDPKNMIRIMDVLLGNTCVMIDRNPAAAERRKLYGRAGEYRLPSHGVEYRTLSNFWLYNYKLYSFVMGMTKMAFSVAVNELTFKQYQRLNHLRHYPDTSYIYDAEKMLMGNVDLERIERAINTNDYDLAKRNFDEWVRPFIAQIDSSYGIGGYSMANFDHFINKIRAAELAGEAEPLKIWFTEDPLKHWCNKPDGHGTGWESWLSTAVERDRAKLPEGTTITGVVEVPTVQTPEPYITPATMQYVEPVVGAQIEV